MAFVDFSASAETLRFRMRKECSSFEHVSESEHVVARSTWGSATSLEQFHLLTSGGHFAPPTNLIDTKCRATVAADEWTGRRASEQRGAGGHQEAPRDLTANVADAQFRWKCFPFPPSVQSAELGLWTGWDGVPNPLQSLLQSPDPEARSQGSWHNAQSSHLCHVIGSLDYGRKHSFWRPWHRARGLRRSGVADELSVRVRKLDTVCSHVGEAVGGDGGTAHARA